MMMRSPIHTIRISVALISLGLAISAGRTIVELWQRRDVVDVRKRELAKIQAENNTLQDKLKDMGSDAYVERVARDQLGMIKEGETIVMLPEGAVQGRESGEEKNIPNWKKWWSLFF